MVEIKTDATVMRQRFRALAGTLQGPGAAAAVRSGGVRMTGLLRRHITRVGQTRHTTANRLGATPTRHFQGKKVWPAVADGATASVPIAIPGIRRAFGPLTIRPRNKQALTIPMHPESYGKTVQDMRKAGWAIFRPKGKRVLWGYHLPTGKRILAYRLVPSVTLNHDPTLLPTGTEIGNAFADGVAESLARSLKGKQP